MKEDEGLENERKRQSVLNPKKDQSFEMDEEEEKVERIDNKGILPYYDDFQIPQKDLDLTKYFIKKGAKDDDEDCCLSIKKSDDIFKSLQLSPTDSLRVRKDHDFTQISSPIHNKIKKKSGFKFYNYTGAELKFCISNWTTDENLNILKPIEKSD